MLQSILKMSGVEKLQKKQQEDIFGGIGGPDCQTDDDCPGPAVCLLGGCHL